jgi:membrane associated rhomboid family serine protease
LEARYWSFLDRAETALSSIGAFPLARPRTETPGVSWARGWDLVMALDAPGGSTVYAMTPAGPDLRLRVDALAKGLSDSGLLANAPLTLVVVPVVTGDGSSGNLATAGSGPSVYYPGLRPRAWVADLDRGRLRAGLRPGAEGSDVLAMAVKGDISGLGGGTAEHHSRQLDAFRTLMGGRQPVITYVLIGVNVALFLLLYTRGGPSNEAALRDFGALSPQLIENGQIWRLFAALFLHASVPHILFNMTSLFAVGTLAERLYGSGKFLAIYIGAGLIGSLCSFTFAVLNGQMNELGVGASGAIFGVAGALVAVRFHGSDVIPERLRRRVSSSMVPLVAVSLIFAYITPHIDNAAHVGGLCGGILLSFIFPLPRRIPENLGV